MAQELVDEARYQAGQRYVDALERLGFSVDYALWTIPKGGNGHLDVQLCIVSRLIEAAGTKTIYDLLFKAYDRAGTPQDIDPWIVSLYGSGTKFARHLTTLHEMEDTAYLTVMTEHGPKKQPVTTWIEVVDRFTRPAWIYKLGHFEERPRDDKWAFERFRRNVEALAA